MTGIALLTKGKKKKKTVFSPLPRCMALLLPREETQLLPPELARRCRPTAQVGHLQRDQTGNHQRRRQYCLCSRLAWWTGPHQHHSCGPGRGEPRPGRVEREGGRQWSIFRALAPAPGGIISTIEASNPCLKDFMTLCCLVFARKPARSCFEG